MTRRHAHTATLSAVTIILTLHAHPADGSTIGEQLTSNYNYQTNMPGVSLGNGVNTFSVTTPAIPYGNTRKNTYLCQINANQPITWKYNDWAHFVGKTGKIWGSSEKAIIELTTPSPAPPNVYTNPDYHLYKISTGIVSGTQTSCQLGYTTITSSDTIPPVTLNVTMPDDLEPGVYDVDIDSYAGMNYAAAYDGSKIENRFSDNSLLNQAKQGYPMSWTTPVTVTARCTSSTTQLNLQHGTHALNDAENNQTTRAFTLTCSEGAEATLTLSTNTPSDTAYTGGIGVDLGNGWDTVLAISDGRTTGATIVLNASSTSETAFPLTVISTIHGTPEKSSGALQGLAILTVTVQ